MTRRRTSRATQAARLRPADGWRGVDITLKFHPNDTDERRADRAHSDPPRRSPAGTPQILPAAASTGDPPAADAKPLNTGTGRDRRERTTSISPYVEPEPALRRREPDERLQLDGSRPTASFGQHGFHFKDRNRGAQGERRQNSTRRAEVAAPAQKDSRQIFETTALATKGAQAGDLLRLGSVGLAHGRGGHVFRS